MNFLISIITITAPTLTIPSSIPTLLPITLLLLIIPTIPLLLLRRRLLFIPTTMMLLRLTRSVTLPITLLIPTSKRILSSLRILSLLLRVIILTIRQRSVDLSIHIPLPTMTTRKEARQRSTSRGTVTRASKPV